MLHNIQHWSYSYSACSYYLLSDETVSGDPRSASHIVATWFMGPSDELPDLVTWLPLYVSPYVIMCLGMSSYVLLGLWTSIYVLLRTSPHVIMCLRTSSNVSMCLTASSYVLIGLRTSLYTLQCLRMSEYKHSRGEIHRILMIDYTFCWLV